MELSSGFPDFLVFNILSLYVIMCQIFITEQPLTTERPSSEAVSVFFGLVLGFIYWSIQLVACDLLSYVRL